MSMPYVPDAYGGNALVSSNGGKPTNTNGNNAVPPQYPPMQQVPDTKPLLEALGAPGTAIMSGIITSEEYNPDWFWRDGVHIVEQMLRNDGQVSAVREMVELPIRSADWSIKPGSDDARDQEIAAFIDSCLFHEMCYVTTSGQQLTQTWDEILQHILMFIPYGFMVFEVNWRQEDDWIKWSHWTPLLPRTIYRWWVGPDTELAGIQQWTWKNYGYHFVDIASSKLLRFARRQEGNNYEGVSALRAPYKHWFYKQNFEKIDAIGIERAAVVPPHIHLQQGFTDGDAAIAKTIVENVRVNELMGVVTTPNMDFEFPKNQQRYAAQVLPSIQYHDVMIARAFLCQFLNLGSTETGTYALAQSQVETFLESLQGYCNYICDVVNVEIKRLVDYNFPDVENYPTLACSKLSAQNIVELADALQKLSGGNNPLLTPDPVVQDWVFDQLGIPHADRNAVDTTNPGSPATPERPENPERSGDHSDEESANVNPGPARGPQRRGAAASGAGAAAAPGDAGGDAAAAETRAIRSITEETRLLTETLRAAFGMDAVERGMQHQQRQKRRGKGQAA